VRDHGVKELRTQEVCLENRAIEKLYFGLSMACFGLVNPTKTYTELIVWQRAHNFVLAVYGFTAKFPREEIYGLTSQMRRAAVSIPANIAEGYAKTGVRDKLRFLNIAQGSLEECRYYLTLARDLNLNDDPKMTALIEETSKLLNAYAKAIHGRLHRSTP
jgi:four helix bundle protein